jgi:quercetin dioxygenase-like cupin family protein
MPTSKSRTIADSSQLKVELVVTEGGEALPWQRCPVADRVLIVHQGAGYCYRATAVDEARDELGPGDVVHLPRMLWHRLVAKSDQKLAAVLVTHQPSDVEMRR